MKEDLLSYKPNKIKNDEIKCVYKDNKIVIIYPKKFGRIEKWVKKKIGGTEEINRMLLVGMILKKAMKGELDIMTPAMKVASELMSIPSFDIPDENKLFEVEKEHLKKLKKAILMTAGKATQHFAMEIEKEQEILMNLADMVIDVYTAESAILRAEKLALKNKEEAEYQIMMSKLFLYSSIKNCQRCGEEVILSFAEGDEQGRLEKIRIAVPAFFQIEMDYYKDEENKGKLKDTVNGYPRLMERTK